MKEIKEVLVKEKIDFLCIQETKMEVVDRAFCSQFWGNNEFDWQYIGARGASGGLLCSWRKSCFEMDACLEIAGVLEIRGRWGADQIKCFIVIVYLPCFQNQRYAIFNTWKEFFLDLTGTP